VGHVHDQEPRAPGEKGLDAALDFHLEVLMAQVGEGLDGDRRRRGREIGGLIEASVLGKGRSVLVRFWKSGELGHLGEGADQGFLRFVVVPAVKNDLTPLRKVLGSQARAAIVGIPVSREKSLIKSWMPWAAYFSMSIRAASSRTVRGSMLG